MLFLDYSVLTKEEGRNVLGGETGSENVLCSDFCRCCQRMKCERLSGFTHSFSACLACLEPWNIY